MLHDIIFFIVGLIVGVMNAVAGGGMLVGFPALIALGIPPLVANASTGVIILPGQLASAYGYRKYLRKVPKQYLLLALPLAIGAAIGATALRHTSPARFQNLAPVLIALAVILFALQPLLHFHLHRHLKGKTKSNAPLWLLACALLPMAAYGGFFGAGFGFIMLAFLGFTNLHDLHLMNGLKNMTAVVIATTVVICLFSAHLIDWRHALIVAAGNLLGGYYGAVHAQKVSTHAIRIVVIIIGLTSAVYLGIHQY